MKLVYLIGKQAGGGGQHFDVGRSISAANDVSGIEKVIVLARSISSFFALIQASVTD